MKDDLSLGINKSVGEVATLLGKAVSKKFTKQELEKIAEEDKKEETKEIVPAKVLSIEEDFHAHYRRGKIAFVATLALITGFAGFMPISGAIALNGVFVVQSSTKKIQHRSGGIVKAILVHNGSRVKAGDILVQLDSTDSQAQADALARQIDETELNIARLTAERDGATKLTPPAKFLLPPAEHTKMIQAQVDYFKIRRDSKDLRISQLTKQIKGLESQLTSDKHQLESINQELKGMEELLIKKVTPLQRVTPLRREKARLEGSIGQLETNIQETRLIIDQTSSNFRSEVLHDLNEATSRINQLLEQLITAKQQLIRTDLVSPISGVVQELNIHTVGGVISPAETLMVIVPINETLEVSGHLPVDKIDQVKIGQKSRIKLSAFERTTPEIPGYVNFVSPDIVVDPKGGSYYEVKVAVEQHPLGLTLSPGMPAEIFLQTQSRTMLSYLIKPLREQMDRAFIER